MKAPHYTPYGKLLSGAGNAQPEAEGRMVRTYSRLANPNYTWRQVDHGAGQDNAEQPLNAGKNGDTIIFSTRSAGNYVYRSTDNGVTWGRTGSGVTNFGKSVCYDPVNATWVACITGATIKRSTDDGATWGADITCNVTTGCVAADSNGSILGMDFASSTSANYSVNGGVSWGPITLPQNANTCMTVNGSVWIFNMSINITFRRADDSTFSTWTIFAPTGFAGATAGFAYGRNQYLLADSGGYFWDAPTVADIAAPIRGNIYQGTPQGMGFDELLQVFVFATSLGVYVGKDAKHMERVLWNTDSLICAPPGGRVLSATNAAFLRMLEGPTTMLVTE